MIYSTLTDSPAELVYEYEVDKIIKAYQKDHKIDVSSFFHGLSRIGLYRCLESDYKFFYPLNISGNGKFYEKLYSGNINYYPSWKWENEKAFTYLNNLSISISKLKVLEIGCGEGYFLKRIRSIYPDFDLTGLELNESSASNLREQNYNVLNLNIEEFSSKNINSFDFVVAFQVLEHIPNVKRFIESCILSLKPGGILFFGVPNNDSYIFKNDLYHILNLPPHHMGHWSNISLLSLSKYFPLQVLEISEEMSDKKNLGIYFDVWLKNHFPKYRKSLYFLFRFPIKMVLKYLVSLKGHTIIAAYQKK